MPPAGPTAADLTVVVSSDDVDGDAVRDLALQWHEDGLLGDFAWVTPAEVERGAYGPPVIRARVTGRDAPVELMSHLGMRPRGLIRVVLLHLLTHEMSDPDTLVETCDEIAELVNRSRPRTLDPQGRHQGSQLLRVNLMVPESDLLPQDPRIILPAWEINAVVSPEDRPELDRQSVFVRRSVNLHSHALAAAATVGGLWAEAATGVFDSHESDSTTGGGEIVVLRCQARVVVGDDGVERLTRTVISALEDSPVGAPAWVSWGVPADNPTALVRSCTEELMTHPEWAPLAREEEPLHKQQIPLRAAMRQWLTFQLLLVPAVFHFLFGWGRGIVERRVTALTVGREAGEEGKVRPLPPDAVEKIAKGRMQQLEDDLSPSRLDEEAGAWAQTTPAAWRELRQLALGLVDGGRLSARFTRGGHGGAVEVVPPGSVVGAPDDHYELGSGQTVGLVDVEAGRRGGRRDREGARGGGAGPRPPSGRRGACRQVPLAQPCRRQVGWPPRPRGSGPRDPGDRHVGAHGHRGGPSCRARGTARGCGRRPARPGRDPGGGHPRGRAGGRGAIGSRRPRSPSDEPPATSGTEARSPGARRGSAADGSRTRPSRSRATPRPVPRSSRAIPADRPAAGPGARAPAPALPSPTRRASEPRREPEPAEPQAGPEADEPDRDDPEEFLAWLEQRRATLLWRLTARALEQSTRERERAERAQKAVADSTPPSTDKLESARGFLVTCWGLVLAALGLILLLNIASLFSDPVEFLTSLGDVFSADVLRVLLITRRGPAARRDAVLPGDEVLRLGAHPADARADPGPGRLHHLPSPGAALAADAPRAGRLGRHPQRGAAPPVVASELAGGRAAAGVRRPAGGRGRRRPGAGARPARPGVHLPGDRGGVPEGVARRRVRPGARGEPRQQLGQQRPLPRRRGPG